MRHIIAITFLVFIYVNQSLQISSKLDFTESREINSHSVKSPKIQGVRVTVDTSKLRQSTESKSDENDFPLDGRKKVGIRTDVTFELDDEKNDSNITSNEKEIGKDDDDDASVPVFKGTSTSNDKNDRNNIYGNRRTDPNNHPSNHDGPVFHRNDDENIRNNNDWANSIPVSGVWTTERNPWRQFNSHNIRNQHGPSGFKSFTPYTIGHGYKPCDCNSPSWRRSNNQDYKFYPDRQRSRFPSVDDKLEEPFKNRN